MKKEPKLVFAYYNPNNEENSIANLVYIGDEKVVSGKDCFCFCPECGEKLIARKGNINAHHFAHISGVECAKGYETSIHLMAKKILSDSYAITLPEYSFSYMGEKRIECLVKDQQLFEYKHVELEKRIKTPLGEIVPDAVLSNDKDCIAIEIFVTHKVNDEKMDRIEERGISTLEITINPREDWSFDKLQDTILDLTDKKKWIYKRGKKEILDRIDKICEKKKRNFLGNAMDCPQYKWANGGRYKRAGYCSICEYCFGLAKEEVYCSFEKAITCIEDFKVQYHELKNNQAKALKEIDVNCIEKGKCPICSRDLYINKAPWTSLNCCNYGECKFRAEINLKEKKLIYVDRYGKEDVIALPQYIIDEFYGV